MGSVFNGARVTVLGLGRFGGGCGVARWLVEQGAQVLVSDLDPAQRLAEPLQSLAPLIDAGRIRLELGGHTREGCTDCDWLVVNPAVPRPWKNPFIRAARAAGVRITTEIRLVTERLDPQRVVGVTGTAGKSTTAAMIHHLLARRAANNGTSAHLGGNIGGSLLQDLDRIGPEDLIVLELSSAMLHWLGEREDGAPTFAPHVGLLTNLAPNHLDWHGSFEHYAASKSMLFAHQRDGDHAIRPHDALPALDVPLALPGAHNRRNARQALAAAMAIAPDVDPAWLSDFAGLPHRLARVSAGALAGIDVFDDSKSTTPEATRLAVAAFPDAARLHVICGGYDKAIDLVSIVEATVGAGGLYTVGATGPALAEAAGARGAAVEHCATLERAVERAVERARPGDVILLSPGCASWDQFTNYEERGRAFTQFIQDKARRRSTCPGQP
ncbi:MAG: Mur ligase family protein [Planctomycetota bacterium]|jgi:UDP-N-acetylmuramoylalanine--D-glutamate ligase